MATLHDLIPRAKDGILRGTELTSGTITVTSLGDLGAESVFGMIYPPQVALVGFGRITEQAWAENGMLGARPILHATLSGDHRATDGHTGAGFLQSLGHLLQTPETL
jgi:pyruvate dehydrogenase E2 component (dihydrolipoamide acetyltransferase)